MHRKLSQMSVPQATGNHRDGGRSLGNCTHLSQNVSFLDLPPEVGDLVCSSAQVSYSVPGKFSIHPSLPPSSEPLVYYTTEVALAKHSLISYILSTHVDF